MNFYEVFIPGGVPTYTYNPREDYCLETKIMQAKRNLCKLMIVTGQTKMGKTVLAEKVYNRDSDSIWVDGGEISDEESFWDNIVSQLEIPTLCEKQNSTNVNVAIETEVEGQLKFHFIETKPKGGIAVERDRLKGVVTTSKMSNKMASIKYLVDNRIPLIVDDFHYIDREIQTKIVRALKSPIMHGLPVIFIAIPSRKFDVLKVEREMTGRIEMFEIPTWSEEELQEIADKGFSELRVDLPVTVKMKMAKEAKDRKEFFNASKYKSYIVSNNEKVKYVFDNFLADKWKKEDRKLNNYVHTNGKNFLMNNYIYQNRKEQQDNELIETVQNITDIFLSLLALIDSKKLQSSDYLDALEMNIEPLEESQYWICPIIEEYMNDRFSKKMLQYIQKNERNGMQIIKQGFSYDGGTTHGA